MRTIELWQEKMSGDVPEDGFIPVLDFYKADRAEHKGTVLICPGGGYGFRADHEGKDIAEAFNSSGFSAFVVHYRVSPCRYPSPQLDLGRAIRLVRADAAAYGVDPGKIAVCGFSAGGHLTASVGCLWDVEDLKTGDELDDISARPDALILCYPVISCGDKGHKESFDSLLGPEASFEDKKQLSLEYKVRDDTPPAFLWHTADDSSVPVQNSLMFADELSRRNIPFELHVYPHGVHGLGLAPEAPEVAGWFDLAVDFLRRMDW